MNFMNKLERKFSKYAISNLTMYLIFGYVAGYVISRFAPGMLGYLTMNPYQILHGQVWRLITWVLIPPSTQSILFYVIMMLFYYQLGMSLERTWGTFRYNVYIFGGILYTAVGAMATWLIMAAFMGNAAYVGAYVGAYVSTYYICMSIFLAFAVCYPNMQVMLYFIIPIKMKWLAYVYAALMIFDFIQSAWPGRIMLVMSLLNFLIPQKKSTANRYTAKLCASRAAAAALPSINVRSAAGQNWTTPRLNSGFVQNATAIMNTARSICLRTSISNISCTFYFKWFCFR